MHVEQHPALARIAFLIGRWEGVGVAGYPEAEEFQFGQEVEFSHDGLPYLNYTSRVWRMNPDGSLGEFVTAESGYWRVRLDEDTNDTGTGTGDSEDPEKTVHVEALISHPEGFSEVYVGNVFANRIEMYTDVVMRTETGLQATASHRLYGLIGEDRENLGYAWDLAAHGHELQSYMSAQLKRVA
ncbi:FABP family protein [Lipingzhangella sp. LS1_29]|uniref:Ferric nitrobindin-like protein n=1 Tax=Lipingzhangella rawalii TaxID=2055835 RepID=A0ABU2H4M6_9ACTN|nr:FABP family protein [Lipingzhangella rawalii]MDS1270250.1 FABP family protein [Lipingzhangella rawalii]